MYVARLEYKRWRGQSLRFDFIPEINMMVGLNGSDKTSTLDLIAIASTGDFAGYCTGQINAAENARTGQLMGYTDPVAVHPNFQGRGLAKALLLSSCRLLKQRGMTITALGTSSENIAMQRAAEAAGYRVQSSKVWLAKSVA